MVATLGFDAGSSGCMAGSWVFATSVRGSAGRAEEVMVRLPPGQTLDARLRAAVPELLPGLGGWGAPGEGGERGAPLPNGSPAALLVSPSAISCQDLKRQLQALAQVLTIPSQARIGCCRTRGLPLDKLPRDFTRRQQSHGASGIASASSAQNLKRQLPVLVRCLLGLCMLGAFALRYASVMTTVNFSSSVSSLASAA